MNQHFILAIALLFASCPGLYSEVAWALGSRTLKCGSEENMALLASLGLAHYGGRPENLRQLFIPQFIIIFPSVLYVFLDCRSRDVSFLGIAAAGFTLTELSEIVPHHDDGDRHEFHTFEAF
jgi:hypothetical protein